MVHAWITCVFYRIRYNDIHIHWHIVSAAWNKNFEIFQKLYEAMIGYGFCSEMTIFQYDSSYIFIFGDHTHSLPGCITGYYTMPGKWWAHTDCIHIVGVFFLCVCWTSFPVPDMSNIILYLWGVVKHTFFWHQVIHFLKPVGYFLGQCFQFRRSIFCIKCLYRIGFVGFRFAKCIFILFLFS